jgi:thymidylate synthase (FAD)
VTHYTPAVIYDADGDEVEVQFRDHVSVKLVQHMGGDEAVVASAKVSTQGAESWAFWDEDPEKFKGLINFLMRNRHGTPFEHNSFTFVVEAPIFVYREWHRHRIAWSYNEESGRYKELNGVFYLPSNERKILAVPGTKAGEYVLELGDEKLHQWLRDDMMEDCVLLYAKYLERLGRGIHKEVARMTLPVNLFSSMYATANARALMAFLSLRTNREDALKPSKPMREIEMCAEMLEVELSDIMPITMAAFEANGRLAP